MYKYIVYVCFYRVVMQDRCRQLLRSLPVHREPDASGWTTSNAAAQSRRFTNVVIAAGPITAATITRMTSPAGAVVPVRNGFCVEALIAAVVTDVSL